MAAPTAIREARGDFIKNPARRPKGEIKPEGDLGDPPAHFDKAHRKLWFDIKKTLPFGIACRFDVVKFEMLICLIWKFRNNREAMEVGEMNLMDKILGQFGGSPADRTKIAGGTSAPSEPDDPWSQFGKSHTI
jgi:hypothetical protein